MCGILASLPMPSPEHVNEREPVREKMQDIVVEILATFPEKSFTKRGRRLRLSKEFVRMLMRKEVHAGEDTLVKLARAVGSNLLELYVEAHARCRAPTA